MTRRARLLVCGVVASMVGFARVAPAMQTAPADVSATGPASATAPALPEGALTVTVSAVQGNVQVRPAEDQDWRPAVVGMQLGEQAEFRTGPRSAVQFKLPPDQTITLDRLGTVKVLTAVQQGGKVKTNIGMKYGRTRYSIEAAGVEHEATISSPSSTLAVRGTDFMDEDQRPFPAKAVSFTGRVEVRDARKRTFVGSKGGSKAAINSEANSAAEFAAGQTVVDPGQRLARTDAEQPLISALLSHGATISFDQEKGIKVVRGGRPLTDKELIPVLPGTLNFVLRWTGNADLNLGVHAPSSNSFRNGTTIYPLGGLNHAPSGGQMGFDHRGGTNGGMEICFWPGAFPAGEYQIGVQHISGVITPAQVDVFEATSKGVDRLPITRGGEQFDTVKFIAGPINPEIAEGIAVGSLRLFPSQSGRDAAARTSGRSTDLTQSMFGPAAVAGPPLPVALTHGVRKNARK
jgi:hypothetical protein